MHTGGDGNNAGGLNEIGDEEGNINGERLAKGHVSPKHHADRTAEVLAGQGGDSAKGKIYGECLAVSPRGEVGDTASNRGGYKVADKIANGGAAQGRERGFAAGEHRQADEAKAEE